MTDRTAPSPLNGRVARPLPTPRELRIGELLYRRARGEAAETDCAKAACRLLAEHYRPGMSVLDAGCGCGHYLPSLRRRVDPAIDYHGVDATPHFVELARRAFPGEERFDVADVTALPFADEAFDFVLCFNVLPSVPPPPRRALAELVRVAGRGVLIRTLFGELNYVIQEVEPGDEEQLELIGAGVETDAAVYNNIYTESYYRELIRSVDASLEPRIDVDDERQRFESSSPGCARVSEGGQIAGRLVHDWRFITLLKPGR